MLETIQTYILMHKDIPVAEICLDSVTASVWGRPQCQHAGVDWRRAQALCKALRGRAEQLANGEDMER